MYVHHGHGLETSSEGSPGYISLGHSVFFAVGGYFAGMIFAR